MKVKLKAGAEIDLLSTDEYRREQEKLRKQIASQEQTIHLESVQYTTAADGSLGTNTGVMLYEVPLGYKATLHRIAITDQLSFITPLQTGFLALLRNGLGPANFVVGIPTPPAGSSNYVLPFIYESGNKSAPVFFGGDQILAIGGNLPANTEIAFVMQIALQER